MALVKRFERTTKEHTSIHGPVDCKYVVFTGSDGKRYLQLDTSGSRSRKIVGKISQSIQLDAGSAAELKRVIDEELLRVSDVP